MNERPRVLVSRCLGFEACRYDGGIIPCEFADALRSKAELIAICPEADLGLGVPRPTLSLRRDAASTRMIQDLDGRDLSDDMRAWCERRLDEIGILDGALLKSRSPSCALSDARLLDASGTTVGRVPGLFADALTTRFSDLACIDEVEAADPDLRERWLARVHASWRTRCPDTQRGPGHRPGTS